VLCRFKKVTLALRGRQTLLLKKRISVRRTLTKGRRHCCKKKCEIKGRAGQKKTLGAKMVREAKVARRRTFGPFAGGRAPPTANRFLAQATPATNRREGRFRGWRGPTGWGDEMMKKRGIERPCDRYWRGQLIKEGQPHQGDAGTSSPSPLDEGHDWGKSATFRAQNQRSDHPAKIIAEAWKKVARMASLPWKKAKTLRDSNSNCRRGGMQVSGTAVSVPFLILLTDSWTV